MVSEMSGIARVEVDPAKKAAAKRRFCRSMTHVSGIYDLISDQSSFSMYFWVKALISSLPSFSCSG